MVSKEIQSPYMADQLIKKKIIKNKSKIKSVGSCSQIVRHTPPKAGNT